MIKKIVQWLKARSAPSEDSKEYDGVFSYALEWHAFVLGLGAGLATGLTGNPELAALVIAVSLGVKVAPSEKLKQLAVEPWYAIGGTVSGYLISMIPA